ncbi:BON domain-containing protein [Collimonas pratensis]|uniref:BON domain protein n=1 Tax=Collimonas pratensis TaxID=279113 RepID=A0ABM5ZA75_9BURK|nr:BON domain-containing protein [Collimonas pratensis]AMP15905.1 BON domain protein [Collimonas pratensis]
MKTDAILQKDVIAELDWDPSVNAAQIGVEVTDGIVTLAGHVGSYTEKWHAERAAKRVLGVKGLAIEIDVALPGSSKRNDIDIARSAENILQWMTYLPKDYVKVMVENGWLTLTGDVAWDYQREAAEVAVHHLMGVTGVSNQITLRPRVSMSALETDIETALKRRARANAPSICVEIHGTDVVLSGTVHSLSERDLAKHSAWNTPGVRNVTNNIIVI